MSDITTRLAHCLRTLLAVPNADSAHAARTTLAEYEAQRMVSSRIPQDYAREQLEKYDAEIEAGTVSYPFYSGVFSQLVRGVVE